MNNVNENNAAFDVAIGTLSSKVFFSKSDRIKFIQARTINLLTNQGEPFAFVTLYDEETVRKFNLVDNEIDTYNREDMLAVNRGDKKVDVVFFKSPNKEEKYILWSLSSFIEMAKDNSLISMPPQMSYFLRNHLEKPFYKQSPSFTFSKEDHLSQYVTAFSRFSGVTANIVALNNLPIEIKGKKEGDKYLLLPNVQNVRDCLSGYKEGKLFGSFYVDLEKKIDDYRSQRLDDVRVFSGQIYDKTLIIVDMTLADELSAKVIEVANCLNSTSNSVPRKTHKNERTETYRANIASDLVSRRIGNSVKNNPPPKEDEDINLDLSQLADMEVLRTAFKQACDNESKEATFKFGGVDLKISANLFHIEGVNLLSQGSFSENIQKFNSCADKLMNNPQILKAISLLNETSKHCIMLNDDHDNSVLIMPEKSGFGTICNGISNLH